jgi:hypothetical protein
MLHADTHENSSSVYSLYFYIRILMKSLQADISEKCTCGYLRKFYMQTLVKFYKRILDKILNAHTCENYSGAYS